MSHLLKTQETRDNQHLVALFVRQWALKQLISKPNFSPSHFLLKTLSESQQYVSSVHYPVCSSFLPPDGSLTSAAHPARPAGMALGWGVERLMESADRLSAREHWVSGTLVPINKQNRTFVFCMVYKGHLELSHISTSIPEESQPKSQ